MPDGEPLSQDGEALTLLVQVAPRASRSALAGVHGGRLKVRIAAPPVDGAANDELLRFLAKTLDIGRSQLEVRQGIASKRKTVIVFGLDITAARGRLGLNR